MSTIAESKIRWPERRNIYLSLLLLAVTGLVFVALVLPLYARLSTLQLTEGEVAPQDFVAPRSISYVSEIRTQQQQDAMADAVMPIFTPPDTTVARQQLERLRVALTYINSVRADPYASTEQKVADLAALESIHLDQEIAQKILSLSDSRWQAVQQEAIVVLEAVMRRNIREDRLDETRRDVPALVSLSLPEEQAAIVAELVIGFVAPNSFYSESLTEAARQQVRQSVPPVNHSYIAGETIVQRGQVVSATDLEALEELGLVQPESRWQDLLAAASLSILASFFILLYLRRNRLLAVDGRGLVLIAVLYLIFLFGARLFLPGHAVIPYLYPLAAFSLIMAALFGAEPAIIFTLPLAIMAAYDLPNSLTLTLYYLIGAFFGVLILGKARRVTSFLWSGLAIAVSGMAVVIAFRLPQPDLDLIGLATLTGVSFLNGIASASLTVLLQFFLAQFLGLTTALQLIELSRPDHPLLQLVLRNSPGTYQHSLQVANLAEQAAERIDADTLLTRVGALYHDAGKALNPFYFIENQVNNSINPHDSLDPLTSSATIIRHVTDGLDLAYKYRLPRRLHDFISEHHGTMLTRYQYIKAVQAAGGDESQVDESLFRYPGPRPQSRETAILMLADGSEARVRAERPKDEEALHALIKNIIENRVAYGELDDTDLTLSDLNKIADSFAATLRGIYHPRLEYPKLDKTKATKPEYSPPTTPAVSRHPAESPIQTEAETLAKGEG